MLSELMRAVSKGDLQRVEELITPTNVNDSREDGFTVLMMAIKRGHSEIAKTLIAGGANVDASDEEGETALMIAAWKNNLEIARLLIKTGADVNASDKDEFTALIYAANQKHEAVMELLIDKGAATNVPDTLHNRVDIERRINRIKLPIKTNRQCTTCRRPIKNEFEV